MLAVAHAGLSDVGRLRGDNQDRWLADDNLGLYLVADGMGGGPHGQLAARIVVQELPKLIAQWIDETAELDRAESAEAIAAAVAEVSQRLRGESRRAAELEGMGSTVAALLVRGEAALTAHLGDSRIYLLRDSAIQQVTTDHSIAQLLVEAGEIDAEEAVEHPARAQLTRFVGMPGEALVETCRLRLAEGDRLLLCSDGLSGMLSDQQISRIVAGHRNSPEQACRQLIDQANAAGGQDNITAIVVELGIGGPPGEADR